MDSSASRLVTRMTLSWRSAASMTASSPATEPVWASAACWPSGLEPTFSATIGLPAASARSAIRANRTGSPISSRNSAITLVAGSSIRYSRTSVVFIIDSLPTEVRMLMPMPCALVKPSTTLASAPLCSTMPTGPAVSGGGRVSA